MDQKIRDRIEDLAKKLKKIEPCVAANHEGMPCNTADIRWVGRELIRIIEESKTKKE